MMNAKKLIVVTVMQAAMVFILNTQSLAVMHTTTYSDGLTLGVWNGPGSATTTTAATVTAMLCGDAVGGGSCYKAMINNPYAFSYADTIMLPQVGQTFMGGFIDQTFHDTTKTHEDWHRAYADALLNVTYGALETWSATYESNKANSAAAALALGNSDLANALTTAQNAFTADFNTDVDNAAFGHQNAVAVIQNIGGVDTWRSQNPDWGQAAVNYANAIRVTFTKGPGNCVLVPEPGTGVIIAVGIIGLAVTRARRPRQWPAQ
jgi:hypothetical protein